jgi:uncharacterized LabA/DUF88 family protein
VDYRTSIFIDFWNFSLQWRDRAGGYLIDWAKVPSALLRESERQLQMGGSSDLLHLEETLVYASYDEDEAGRRLRGWLEVFLDRQPRFRVTTRPRRSKPRSVYCRACERQIEECPHCHEPMRWSPEKGVDTSIVTGLMSLAGVGAFDTALLVSSDTDYLPAVEWLQSRGFKVINATWANHGHELARACWTSFEIDAIVDDIRQEGATRATRQAAMEAAAAEAEAAATAEAAAEAGAATAAPPVGVRLGDELDDAGGTAANGGAAARVASRT